jgi:tetratricopeptide (TPR) repeat protein
MAKVQNTLANAYLQGHQYERAIAVAQKAFTFAEAANAPYYIATNAATLATAYVELHQFEQARLYAEHALALEEPQAILNAFWVLARIAYEEEQWQTAETYYRQSIETARQQENILFEAYALADLAETYKAQGKKDEATRSFENSILLFDKLAIAKEVQRVRTLLNQLSMS